MATSQTRISDVKFEQQNPNPSRQYAAKWPRPSVSDRVGIHFPLHGQARGSLNTHGPGLLNRHAVVGVPNGWNRSDAQTGQSFQRLYKRRKSRRAKGDTNGARWLYQICDEYLARSMWLPGEDLSIADFSVYPWCAQMDCAGTVTVNIPNLSRWFDRRTGPSVQKGMSILSKSVTHSWMTDAEREIMSRDHVRLPTIYEGNT